ncbi:MAG TPA: PKD domain-containing protein, partial [Thermoanaerobaculia bacterium]|nr:PKD domain-containing protein [Thermoanaerobaculia bacterium]
LSYTGATVSSHQTVEVKPTDVTMDIAVDTSGGEKVSLAVSNISIPYDSSDQYLVYWGEGDPVLAFNTPTSPAAQAPAGYIYSSVGPKLVGIQLTLRSGGPPKTFYKWVDIRNNAPIPAFTVAPLSTDPELGRRFTVAYPPLPATAIDEQMESIVTGGAIPPLWVWDFGDGTSVSNPRPDPIQHTYPYPGAYTATLRVTDHLGAVGSASQKVTIVTTPRVSPFIDFTFDCTAGLRCDFCSLDDPIWSTSFAWNFGDNTAVTTSAGITASHTFPAAGRYTVTETVTGNDGRQYASSGYVTVVNPDLSPGLAFFAVTPCRLFDSRSANGGAALTNSSDTFVQVGGKCGVPAGAKVVAATFAAITPTGDGYFKVYDPTKALPSDALSFVGGTTGFANNAFAPLASDGRLAIRTATSGTATTHLIIDVTGYFADWNSIPVPPANGFARGPYAFNLGGALFDSKWGPAATPLLPSAPQWFQLKGGPGLLPADAGAAFLNLEIKDPPGGGYVTLYPSELASKPGTSTLNLSPHIQVSNATVMALSGRTNDDVAMTYTGGGASTDYIL